MILSTTLSLSIQHLTAEICHRDPNAVSRTSFFQVVLSISTADFQLLDDKRIKWFKGYPRTYTPSHSGGEWVWGGVAGEIERLKNIKALGTINVQ